MAKRIIVAGGAGFIGSHVNKILSMNGYETVVLDDLSAGAKEAVIAGRFIQGDMGDKALLKNLFTENQFDAAFLFSALTDVGESVKDPARYYETNVTKTLNFLSAMVEHGLKTLIFSSSAAVYGIPHQDYVKESDPTDPINPYGRSKLIIETILKDYYAAYGLSSCSLRYFNAAGGDPDGEIKNFTKKECNLIPLILRGMINDTPITIYGTDYPTTDGTGVRDYIHVMDLASAHIQAMKSLFDKPGAYCYNLGNGRGYSVKEVIKTAEKITNRQVKVQEGPRRPGDPAILMADSGKAKNELGWRQNYPDLESMVRDAWISYTNT